MATLEELREATGMTQEQLAAKLAVPSGRITAWESGAQVPTRMQRGLLALALGVTPEAVRAALAAGEREGPF